jgi:hypothetical protein
MQQVTSPGAPAPTPIPIAPATPSPAVTIDGQELAQPQAVYQAFRAQRRELSRQMETLQETRSRISEQLRSESITEAEKRGLEQRLTGVDERIAAMDKQIAEADAAVARSAALPGAAVEPPPLPDNSADDGVYVVATVLTIFVLMPIALAYARGLWRRSTKIITTFPQELADRLMRVEQSVEATALEVERIGEGQRFITRLFTESPNAQALRQPVAERIGAPQDPNR